MVNGRVCAASLLNGANSRMLTSRQSTRSTMLRYFPWVSANFLPAHGTAARGRIERMA